LKNIHRKIEATTINIRTIVIFAIILTLYLLTELSDFFFIFYTQQNSIGRFSGASELYPMYESNVEH